MSLYKIKKIVSCHLSIYFLNCCINLPNPCGRRTIIHYFSLSYRCRTQTHSLSHIPVPSHTLLSHRVRPLSESLNDLFREVSHLQRRITDLNNRLATLEPFLRHHGYREEGEEGGDGKELAPQSVKGMGQSQTKYSRRYMVRVVRPMNRVVRTRRVKVLKNQNGRVKTSESER